MNSGIIFHKGRSSSRSTSRIFAKESCVSTELESPDIQPEIVAKQQGRIQRRPYSALSLTFLEVDVQNNFSNFRRKDFCPFTFRVLMIFITIINITHFIFAVSFSSDISFVSFSVLSLVFATSLGWAIYFIRCSELKHSALQNRSLFIKYSSWCRQLECLFIISCTASVGTHLLLRALLGECKTDISTILYSSQYCNPYASLNCIPEDAVPFLLMVPISLQIILRGVPSAAVFASWVISFLFWITTVLYVGATSSSTMSNPVLFIITAVIMYEYEHQTLQRYLSTVTHERTIQRTLYVDHEKRVMASQAIELRNLIANVAHDLKTPIQAFVVGLESLQESLQRNTLKPSGSKSGLSLLPQTSTSAPGGHSNVLHRQYSSSSVSSLCSMNCSLDTIANLNATASFMTMIVNRAIDYTKCSNGISLVPCSETIHLWSTICWPINCVRCVQSRVDINVEPLPPDLPSHISTDKQWLQENLLCLVSNAVKYSDSGSVTVRVIYDPSTSCKMLLGGSLSLSPPLHAMIRLEVEDSCHAGISEEVRKKLFSPFRQANRHQGGTGLGLYCLAKRSEALGGEYGVASRKDGGPGSLFYFSLPCVPALAPLREYSEDGRSLDRRGSAMSGGDSSPDRKKRPSISFTVETGIKFSDTDYPLCDDMHARYSNNHLSAASASPLCPSQLPTRRSSVKDNAEHCIDFTPPTTRSNSTFVVGYSTRPLACSVSMKVSLSILLVDDSLTILNMTTRSLEKMGHCVTKAENGAIAFELMKQRKYDVVLMDLQMPVMDGFTATASIRSHEETLKLSSNCRQVIIGVSANSDDQTRTAALRSGMNAFLAKPFTMSRFSELLQDLEFVGSF